MADDPESDKTGVTRLGTPSAFILLLGLGLVYYALRGWDRKYNTFGGTLGGRTNTTDTTATIATTASNLARPVGTA